MASLPYPSERARDGAGPAIAAARLSGTLLRILLTVAIVAAGGAVGMLLYQFGVARRSVFYLASVIIVAASFGTRHGLVGALVAVLAYDFFVEEPLYSISFVGKPILINAILFGGAALLSGVYADRFQRQQAAMRTLLDATKGFTAVDPVAWRSLAAHRDEPGGIAGEAARIGIGLAFVAASAAAAFALQAWFGLAIASGAFVVAILATAALAGARAALMAALAAVAVDNAFFQTEHVGLALGAPQDLVNLALFAGVAWFAGSGIERIRVEQLMSRTTLEASTQLSTIDQECQLRATLHEAICRLSGANSAWVLDEHGAASERSGPPPPELAAARVAATGSGTHDLQAWRIRPLDAGGRDLGAVIWLSSDMRGSNGADQQRTIGMLADLAAAAILRVRLGQEKAARELTEQAEKLRAALLSSMSHDFRTPLAGILGSATSLLELGDRYDDRQRTDLLLNVRDQAFRLNRYIENLLSLTRLEAGALKAAPRPEDVEPIVYDAWEALGDAGGARRMLEAQISRDAKALIDPVLFHQALTNVLENAVKYSPEGSTVRVRTVRTDDRLSLEVADEGPGAAPDELEAIFDRFHRGRDASAPGTGLGLYIARCLVEAMNGRIAAQLRDDGGRGLVISISLPAPSGTEGAS